MTAHPPFSTQPTSPPSSVPATGAGAVASDADAAPLPAAFSRLEAAVARLDAATAVAARRDAERQSAVAALQARLDQVIGRLTSVLEE